MNTEELGVKRRLVLLTACLSIFLTACSGEEEMKSSSSMDEAEIVSSEPAESQEEIKIKIEEYLWYRNICVDGYESCLLRRNGTINNNTRMVFSPRI